MRTTQSLLAGFSVGLLAGYLIKKGLRGRPLSSERVLSEVKTALKDNMDVDGAWIYLQPEEWENGKLKQMVYHGGVTENDEGDAVHYDFIADAMTGTIIQLTEQ